MKSGLYFPADRSTRRHFLKTAGALGAVSWGGGGALLKAEGGATSAASAPAASLTTPLGPPRGSVSGEGPPLAPPDRQPPGLKVPEPVVRKVGWAVVGLGELALGEILPAFRGCERSRVVALVSGHADKARKVAAVHGVPPSAIHDYSNYEQLADNPAVEAIYIVLPNSMHAEFTIRGLRAGKHVLCEKPMAVTVAECEAMIAAAREARKILGIAYRLHHEPMTLAARELCRRKALGEPRLFTSSHCQDVKAPNIRLSAALGGGAAGDLGVYSINTARHLLGEEPVEVAAWAQWPDGDPRFRETPASVSYLLRFPSGVLAQCDCSFGTATSSRFRLLGTKGFVEMDPGFAYRGLRLRVGEASEQASQVSEPRIEAVNQFTREIDAFSRCVLEGGDFATPGEAGLADMRVVLAIHESIRRGGQAVKV